MPRSLCGRIRNARIRSIQPSDHTGCPQLLLIPLNAVPRKRPQWRMNSSHLGSPYVIRRLNQLLNDAKSSSLPAYDRLLRFKQRVRKFLIQYGIEKAALKRAKEERLTRDRETALRLLTIVPESSVVARQLFNANNAIGTLLRDNEIARIERRSHAWLRDGDRCTRRFFRPFRKGNKNAFTTLRPDAESTACCDVNGMLGVVHAYYTSLHCPAECEPRAQQKLLQYCPPPLLKRILSPLIRL